MNKSSSGHYILEIDGATYKVDKHEEYVIGPSGDEKTLVTWTPSLVGDEKAFGGRSYSTYKEARSSVYDHIENNAPDLV